MLFSTQNPVTYFASTNFRNAGIPFGIQRSDRLSHMYVIGKTGTGKTTLLETLIRQDLANGEGAAVLDPHGDLVEKIARSMPEHRKDVDLIKLPNHHIYLKLMIEGTPSQPFSAVTIPPMTESTVLPH